MPRIAYSADNDALYHPDNGETFLQDAHWPGEIALTAELSRLAYVRAETGGAQQEILQTALQAAGFAPPRLLVERDLDAYGFASCNEEGLCVLAFRGTQADHYEDFLTNIQVGFVRWPLESDHGHVHGGFLKSAKSLLAKAEPWLQETAARRTRLLVCGHSLGGAIANLLAIDTHADALITFGCPRVGDDEFVDHLIGQPGLQIIRVLNCCDAVPTVPFSFMGYEHAGNALHIDCNGLVLEKPSYSALKADRAAGRKAYAALFVADPLSRVPLRQLADHAPLNYIRAFWP